MAQWIQALEGTSIALALRGSFWAYPLVNAGHILGVCLLVGAIVPLDLRLLGCWPSVSAAALWRVLTRCAAAGLTLAVACGVLLFITRASAYADSRLFLSKMIVIVIGSGNTLILHWRVAKGHPVSQVLDSPPLFMRVGASVSLACWVTALTLGRLVGYF